MIDFLNSQPLLMVLAIISLGYIIGSIRIKGFALESSAILFVALVAGHFGLKVPGIFRVLGLALFIYSIGLQAGPRISHFFKKEGMAMNLLAFLIVTAGACTTALGTLIFGFGKEISVGIFTGALTSTPGLAAAYEATQSGATSIGYGIAYPMGVIGVIIFIKLLPLMLRVNISQEEKKELESMEKDQPPVMNRLIKIANPNVFGKAIKDLNITGITGCVISRLVRGENVEVPSGNTILEQNDIVRVVGKEDNIDNATLLLGYATEQKIPAGKLDMARFVLTNKELVGKKLRDLKLRLKYEANVTRVGRSGIDIPASPDLKLEWGDRISIVAENRLMDDIKSFFGDDIKKASEGNLFAIALGITLGILAGLLSISIGGLSFELGLTGGVLLSGLVLSNRGRLGPIIWRVPYNIINFIRDLGLIFFLAEVGTDAGTNFIDIIEKNGLSLVLWGTVVTMLPMFFTLLVARKMKLNIFQLFGLIPGGMTSTPGFATAATITSSPTPAAIYAAVYPIAMITMIIWSKILAAIPF